MLLENANKAGRKITANVAATANQMLRHPTSAIAATARSGNVASPIGLPIIATASALPRDRLSTQRVTAVAEICGDIPWPKRRKPKRAKARVKGPLDDPSR